MNRCAVLITGSAQGIGLAIAERFAAVGEVDLVLVDKNGDKLHEAVEDLKNKFACSIVPMECDVGDAEAVKAALASTRVNLDHVSVLVNNAGYGGPFHEIDEVSDKEWNDVFGANVKGLFHFCRALLPTMKSAGYGRVINIASIQGFLGAKRSSTYVAAKHAVIGYTRAIAAEWGPYGITCNAICPGYIDTAMGAQKDHGLEHERQIKARTPAGRLGTPAEVASLVMHLSRVESQFVNGSVLTVDGGFSAHIGF